MVSWWNLRFNNVISVKFHLTCIKQLQPPSAIKKLIISKLTHVTFYRTGHHNRIFERDGAHYAYLCSLVKKKKKVTDLKIFRFLQTKEQLKNWILDTRNKLKHVRQKVSTLYWNNYRICWWRGLWEKITSIFISHFPHTRVTFIR